MFSVFSERILAPHLFLSLLGSFGTARRILAWPFQIYPWWYLQSFFPFTWLSTGLRSVEPVTLPRPSYIVRSLLSTFLKSSGNLGQGQSKAIWLETPKSTADLLQVPLIQYHCLYWSCGISGPVQLEFPPLGNQLLEKLDSVELEKKMYMSAAGQVHKLTLFFKEL